MPVRTFLSLAIAVLASAVHGGEVRYVDDDAPAGGDGRAWRTAYRHLQDALLEAWADPAVLEIRIAGGTHRPDEGTGRIAGDRESRFAVRGGLALRGGYAGPGAKNPDARDHLRHATVLTGDLLGDDGPDFAGTAENAYQIVEIVGQAAPCTLDGLVIRGGRADGPHEGASPLSRDQGAAVNVHDADATMLDCVFEANWSANHGAVNDHGNVVLERCVFRGNRAESHGAGLYSHTHAHTFAFACIFESNVAAEKGGGFYSKAGLHAVLLDCQFTGNAAGRGGGAYLAEGAAVEIVGCIFEQNAANEGGAVYNDHGFPDVFGSLFVGNAATTGEGGGAFWNEGGAGAIVDCMLQANTASQGGGIYNRDSNVAMRGCAFLSNVAITGGALWNLRERPLVENCGFWYNEATTGGGVYNEESFGLIVGCLFIRNRAIDGDGGGGMVNAFDSGPTIVDCAFVANEANNDLFGGGGGLANYISSARTYRSTFVRNSASLGGGAIYNELDLNGVKPVLANCRFEGNRAGDGGAILCFRSDPVIANSTFVGNAADLPGERRGGALLAHFISVPRLVNCTMVANAAQTGGGVHAIESAAPVLVNTIVQDNVDAGGASNVTGVGAALSWSLLPGGAPGPGNLDGLAVFASPPHPGPDGDWGTDDDDYGDLVLAGGSPGIDAGRRDALPLDAIDLDADGVVDEFLPQDVDGASRFADDPDAPNVGCGDGATIDMGARERGADGALSTMRPADLDGDGAVGPLDLVALLAAWGACPGPCCPADVDDDGAVGWLDALRVLSSWE